MRGKQGWVRGKNSKQQEREHLKIYEQRPQSSPLCGMPKRNKRAFIMPHGAGAAATPACVCVCPSVCVVVCVCVCVCHVNKQTHKQTNQVPAGSKFQFQFQSHQNSTNFVFFFSLLFTRFVDSNTRRMRNICIEPS